MGCWRYTLWRSKKYNNKAYILYIISIEKIQHRKTGSRMNLTVLENQLYNILQNYMRNPLPNPNGDEV